jgi:hypothetical protein
MSAGESSNAAAAQSAPALEAPKIEAIKAYRAVSSILAASKDPPTYPEPTLTENQGARADRREPQEEYATS